MSEMIFKRNELGFLVLCAWNNIAPEQAPPEFGEHLNEWSAQAWNRVIKAVRKYDAEHSTARAVLEAIDLPYAGPYGWTKIWWDEESGTIKQTVIDPKDVQI